MAAPSAPRTAALPPAGKRLYRLQRDAITLWCAAASWHAKRSRRIESCAGKMNSLSPVTWRAGSGPKKRGPEPGE